MVYLLAVMLIVSLSLNKAEANSWEEMEEKVSGTQFSPELDVKDIASIQFKTDSPLMADKELMITVFDDSDKLDMWIYFGESVMYFIEQCTSGYVEFPDHLPSDDQKLWTFAFKDNRITVHVNDVEVMDFQMSADTCNTFKDLTEVTRIQLQSGYTAIAGYRLTPQEDETGNEEGGDTDNEEGGDMGHYSHAFNCKASGIVLASFLCVLNLII